MYLLKNSFGEKFERINKILNQHINMLNGTINLIASASYPFKEVLQALGYPLFIFPVEGLPNNRYFPGTSVIDDVEKIAEELIQDLFNLDEQYKATIQPHSGTQANQIVFNAVLNAEDLVLSMKPSHGGHISHTTLIGKRNPVIYYNLNENYEIDYDNLRSIALKYKPKLIIAGSSSYPRKIDYKKIKKIAEKIGAFLLADISHSALFIISGDHGEISPYVDFSTFTFGKNLRGPHGGVLIYKKKYHKKVSYSVFPKTQGGPMQQSLFAKLVCLQKLKTININEYSNSILRNAKELGKIIKNKGIDIITKGTDSHIVLIDLSKFKITGFNIEKRFESYSILVNRNLIPFDKEPPLITSGIRIGSTCITNLGYSLEDVRKLGEIISNLILQPEKPHNKEINKLITKYHVNSANVVKE